MRHKFPIFLGPLEQEGEKKTLIFSFSYKPNIKHNTKKNKLLNDL